jgi:hypothetical protein
VAVPVVARGVCWGAAARIGLPIDDTRSANPSASVRK